MMRKSVNNWDFLRHQLVEAKVRDAFGTHKFYVNGQCLRVLRLLGQGGSAQVILGHGLSHRVLRILGLRYGVPIHRP